MRDWKNKRGPRPLGPARFPSAEAVRTAVRGVSDLLKSDSFTLRDEARNTANHGSSVWGRDAKLRDKPITFVSAGVARPLDDLKAQQSSEEDTTAVTRTHTELKESPVNDVQEAEGDLSGQTLALKATIQTLSGKEFLAVMPTESPGAGNLTENGPTIVCNTPSSQSAGHPTVSLTDAPGKKVGANGALPGKAASMTAPFCVDLVGDKNMALSKYGPTEAPIDVLSVSDGSDSGEDVILFKGKKWHADQKANAKAKGMTTQTSVPIDPLVLRQADRNRESRAPVLCEHPVPTEGVAPTTSSAPATRGLNSSKKARPGRDKVEDEDNLAIEDYIANILAESDDDFASPFHTARELGGEDTAYDMGQTSLLPSDHHPKSRKHNKGIDLPADSAASGGGDEEDSEAASDGGMDADLDDETLARLLSKQEELGIGSDDLVLFDSDAAKSEIKQSSATSKSRLSSARKGGEAKAPLPRAQAVSAAFEGLSISDQGGPQQPGKRNRKKLLPNFFVSDSELEANMQAAWYKDREKKKLRKMQREELRKQGLLGRNTGPDDLSVKYQDGMKLDDIKLELKVFLMSDVETLSFPPLDTHARKTLHEIAHKFHIKSQSTGKGDQRRPILTRTKATVRYSEDKGDDATRHVDLAAARVQRKNFPRLDRKETADRRPGAGRSGGHGVTYRDGEIAGASAPQIGQGNKGRTMLEKMGWASGMALGVGENKGILEPVAQVVKRSKAGLG